MTCLIGQPMCAQEMLDQWAMATGIHDNMFKLWSSYSLRLLLKFKFFVAARTKLCGVNIFVPLVFLVHFFLHE